MDKIRERCLELARMSPCQKRGFGVVAKVFDYTVAETFNHPVDSCTAKLCEPECIRFKIPSGSDSMIGACGHAEEHALWALINDHPMADLKEVVLYVAGADKEGVPFVKDEAYFYCIRCATVMIYAKIRGINVWVGGDDGNWVFMTPQEAYESSIDFALKERVTY